MKGRIKEQGKIRAQSAYNQKFLSEIGTALEHKRILVLVREETMNV